jgi:hypothetical protein
VLHRKRKRQREQQQQTKRQQLAEQQHEAAEAADEQVHTSQVCSREDSYDGVAGSSGSRPVTRGTAVRRRISSTAGYASHDGVAANSSSGNGTTTTTDGQPGSYSKGRRGGGFNPRLRKSRAPGASSAPALDHSANGSPICSPDASSGELDEKTLPVQHVGSITATEVQFLDVGETGFGSVCGGAAPASRLPGRDSVDLQSMFEGPAAVPRPGRQVRQQQQQRGGLRSSLSGMASAIRSSVNGLLHSSQAGAAYKVPNLKSSGDARRGSLDIPQGERGPTLPGARQGSILVPAAAAAEIAAKAASIAAGLEVSGGSGDYGAGVQMLQLAPAATSARLQQTVPTKWVLPTSIAAAGLTAPRAAAGPGAATFGRHMAGSAAAISSFFDVAGGVGANGGRTAAAAAHEDV